MISEIVVNEMFLLYLELINKSIIIIIINLNHLFQNYDSWKPVIKHLSWEHYLFYGYKYCILSHLTIITASKQCVLNFGCIQFQAFHVITSIDSL